LLLPVCGIVFKHFRLLYGFPVLLFVVCIIIWLTMSVVVNIIGMVNHISYSWFPAW